MWGDNRLLWCAQERLIVFEEMSEQHNGRKRDLGPLR